MLALLATITLLETQDVAPPGPPAAPPATRLAQAPPVPPVLPTPPGVAPLPPRPPRPPRAPLPLPPVPGADDVLRGDWPAAPSGVHVTLDEHLTVDDAVEAIAKKAGWSASLNTGRVGDRLLVLHLGDVPAEEALRAVLGGTGLVATRRGRVVAVSPAYGPVAARAVLTGFDTPSGKKFSGEFDDEDGRDALLAIGKSAGLSIVLPQGTLGKVTAHLKDVPVEEALKAVLTQAGLQAVREGSIVTVTEGDGAFGGRFEFHGELGPAMEQAMRDARRAQRDLAREQREAQDPDGQDVNSTGGDVVVEAGQDARDVLAVKGSVTLRAGASARDVVAVLGSVTLEPGANARQAVAVGGDIRVGPGASVERDAVSVGGRVQVDPSGDVGGQRQAIDLPHLPRLLSYLHEHLGHGHHGQLFRGGETSPFWRVAAFLGQYLLYLALGLLLVGVFPRRVEAVGAAMVASPGRSLLIGLFGWVGQPVLSVLLIATVVGILLLPVQALLVALAVVLGFTSLSYLVGRAIPGLAARGSWVLQLAVGTAIVLLVTEIPVLGIMAIVTAALVTFGAVLRTRFGQLVPEPPLPTSAIPPPPPPPIDPQAGAPLPPVG